MTEEQKAQFDQVRAEMEKACNHLAKSYSSLHRSEKMIAGMERRAAKESK